MKGTTVLLPLGILAPVVSAPVLAGLYVASRATAPAAARRYDVPLYGITRRNGTQCLVLQRSERTRAPGTYSIWYEGGHAQLGDVVREDNATVAREIIRVDGGDLGAATKGAWSGHAHITPGTLGLTWADVEIDTENGPAPAWRINPPEGGNPSVWAIHIHGLGSSRSGVLRSVIAAAKANMVSLVISYRNDGEGPTTPASRSTLGIDEANDVAAAIDHAIAHGARHVILFGWSMGANMALKLMVEGHHKDSIAGVIAISPVLDWTQALRSNCRQAGLPALVGSVAAHILTTTLGAKILRLPHPINLDQLDWLNRAPELHRPILLIHGTKDTSVPIDQSRRLAQRAANLVTFHEFHSDHTLEWNTHPQHWQDNVLSWIACIDAL